MKKILFAIALLTAGCSNEIVVHSDYDNTVDLSRYKTYKWLPIQEKENANSPFVYNELTDKRMHTYGDAQLKAAGFTQTSENPDVIIHYHIVIEDRSIVRTDPYGYYYGSYWMTNQKHMVEYKEGTLLIDMMDASNKSLIWRGWAVSLLDDDKDIPESLIKSAVEKIFKAYPPQKTPQK